MNDQKRKLVKGLTVDGPTSRDLDDAFWITYKKDIIILDISISDVSDKVTLGSELDLMARKSGFTRYKKYSNIPMFPHRLSEGELSLLPNQERKTITFTISLDIDTLDVIDLKVKRSKLKSRKRFTHEKVDSFITNKTASSHKMWHNHYLLAQRLISRRRKKGALAIYDLKKDLLTDENGNIIKIPSGQFYKAYLIVQEIMILTNQAVTEFCSEKGIPILYRNHETNMSNDVKDTFLNSWNDIIGSSYDVQKIEEIRKQYSHLVKRARYEIDNKKHFGLQLDHYAHWTSPIRRYPDLVNHYQLCAYLDNMDFPLSRDEMKTIAESLNNLSDEERDNTSQHFKNEASKLLATSDKAILYSLNRKQISNLIQSLTKNKNTLDETRLDFILELLQAESLSYFSIANILFYKPERNIKNWGLLKKNILQWIEDQLEAMTQIFNIGHVNFKLPKYKIVREQKGQGHELNFSTSVSIITDKEYVSDQMTAKTKKNSLQLALYSLVKKMSGDNQKMKMVSKKSPEVKTTNISNQENYKGKLNEMCQKMQIDLPTFDVDSSGMSHSVTFDCVATLIIGDKSYSNNRNATLAKTKKDAEQLAAKLLLQLIPKQEKKEEKIDFSINPISSLQEFYAKQNLPIPSYEITGDVRKFKCIVVIEGEEDFIGRGNNKKTAKRNAALHACQSLLA